MSVYIPASPNKFDAKLIPVEIEDQYFSEYIGLSPLSKFFGYSNAKGDSPGSVIIVSEMMAGHGDRKRVSFKRSIGFENPKKGYDQLRGSEKQVVTVEDEVLIEQLRDAVILYGVDFVKQITPIDVFNQQKPSLLEANQRLLIKNVLDVATRGDANLPGPYYNVDETKPSYDRIIVAGYAPNRATYNGLAGLTTALNNFGAATYNASGLSINMIRQLKSYAVNGGALDELNPEPKLRPTGLKTKEGFPEEKYVMFIDPMAYTSLANDPDWKQFAFQGMVRAATQAEFISGARFRGEVEGVMIYEFPELGNYRTVSQDEDKMAAWNLFMGAQAFSLVWGSRIKFNTEWIDYNQNFGLAYSEIRGQKALMFPSDQVAGTQVEHGIIHAFTRIA